MKKSYFAAAMAMTACMLMGAAAVSAQSKNVTATTRPDITLKVNGTAYTIRDSNGNEVAPLLYQGTTYVPLAALGRMLDAQVTWDEATKTVSVNDQSTAGILIGEEKAKQIALDHAGVSASQANFLQVRLDWDNGRQEYEVEFWSGNTEYDYEIDAATGEIRSYDRDIENYEIPSSSQSGNYISVDQAKQIALNHAGVSASQATFVQARLGWDDGRQEYEVEFWAGNTEYDYEIDAATGEIRSYDRDIENYEIPSTSQSGNYISVDQAKQIALNHAGVSASQATFVQARLGWDDGRQEYEVEFWAGNTEYDYEIDAATGEIRSYDRDIENYEIPSTSQNGNYISVEKAKELAQNRAPSATLVKIELDYDDGRAAYEGELREGAWEYEFEINATTGEFIKWEKDWND